MFKRILVGISLLCCFMQTGFAQKQYITDEFDIMFRVAPSIGSKIIKPLPTGTPLTVIIDDAGNAHSQVRTEDGLVGYVLTRFISPNQPAKIRVARLENQLKDLQENPDELSAKYLDLQKSYDRLSQNLKNTIDKKDEAEGKYESLKAVSGNAASLNEKANDLQTKVEQLVLQVDDMRIQNETLKDQSEKKSWIVGALIALFGAVMGQILTSLAIRRKKW